MNQRKYIIDCISFFSSFAKNKKIILLKKPLPIAFEEAPKYFRGAKLWFQRNIVWKEIT